MPIAAFFHLKKKTKTVATQFGKPLSHGRIQALLPSHSYELGLILVKREMPFSDSGGLSFTPTSFLQAGRTLGEQSHCTHTGYWRDAPRWESTLLSQQHNWCHHNWYMVTNLCFLIFYCCSSIVVFLSTHHSSPPTLGFVRVSFIVVPENPSSLSPYYLLPPPLWLLSGCS